MTLIEVRNKYELFVGLCEYNANPNQFAIVIVGELAFDEQVSSNLYGAKNIFYVPYTRDSFYGKVTYNLLHYKQVIDKLDTILNVIVFHDSSPYVYALSHDCHVYLYEHGVANYYSNYKILRSYGFVSLISNLLKHGGKSCGRSKLVDAIFLQSPQFAPEDIQHKVQHLDLQGLWNTLSTVSRYNVQALFGCNNLELESFDKCDLVVTQNFSEIGFISEDEKIRIYTQLIAKSSDNSSVVIKPHPHELTDYKTIFPQSTVLPHDIPIELLLLLGLKPKSVSTLYSSSALRFIEDESVVLHWYGTEISEMLYEKVGRIDAPYKNSNS